MSAGIIASHWRKGNGPQTYLVPLVCFSARIVSNPQYVCGAGAVFTGETVCVCVHGGEELIPLCQPCFSPNHVTLPPKWEPMCN